METAPDLSRTRPLEIDEPRRTPVLSLLLGSAAMVPIVGGAILSWCVDAAWPAHLTLLWSASVLAFLAGVRRGLSFRTPGGARPTQIATMLFLFALAFAALVAPWPLAGVVLLIIGFASVGVLDPAAAPRREVPPYFAALRPVQMLAPVLALGLLAARFALAP